MSPEAWSARGRPCWCGTEAESLGDHDDRVGTLWGASSKEIQAVAPGAAFRALLLFAQGEAFSERLVSYGDAP